MAINPSLARIRDESIALLIRGATGTLLVTVIGRGIAFGASIVLARALGPDEYGVYIYVLTWLTVMSLVSQLGFHSVLLRFVSAYSAEKKWGLTRGVISYSTLVCVAASIVVAVLAGTTVWFWREWFGIANARAFLLSLPLIVLVTVAALRAATLRALKRAILSAVPENIIRPILIAIGVGGLVLLSNNGMAAGEALLVNLVATTFIFFIGTILVLRCLPTQVKTVPPKYLKRQWWRTSLPMFFSTGMTHILAQSDIIIVGAMLGPTQAGFYAVASRLASFSSLGKQAADHMTAPMISEFYATDRRVKLSRLVVISARGVMAFTAVTALVLALIGKPLLALYGSAFGVSYVPLLVLLAGHLFKASFASAGYLLSMTGHHDYSAYINGVCASINLILLFILIPRFGLLGAAAATALTNAIWSLSLMICAWTLMKINPTAFARLPADTNE